MRRFLGLAVLLFCTIPFGLSVTGCGHSVPVTYCSGGDTGPVVGQVSIISLETSTLALTGESLNFGQIGQSLSASAQDCKGGSVSVKAYTYSTTDSTLQYADINPSTGQVCAGHWNRQTGGGIADYTTCTAPTTTPPTNVFYITASAGGAVSNAVPLFIHPVVTSVSLGSPSTNCTTDPATNCCPIYATGITAPAYSGTSCLSQGTAGQLVARVYANGGTGTANNITCEVGRVSFSPLNAANVVTIDQNGVATANQPGSVIVTGTIANSSTASDAGFFSTCPPTSITLAVPNSSATSINVSLNNTQPLVTTVTDQNGTVLSGVNLEFNSTTPQTIPAGSGSVTPAFPGAATITAVCQPATCNPAPFSQIGLFGNGKPITSNGINVTTAGTSSTVLYVGSTQSQYIFPYDFTTQQPGTLIKLPYVPNSMVISEDGSAVYFGSTSALMTLSTGNNSVGAANLSVPGVVLSVSPDGSTIVVTDPVRQTISLVGTSGAVQTSTGGVGTRAQWSPDSQMVYVTTTGNTLLTHSNFTSWQSSSLDETYTDVAVTVPSIGAYFAGTRTEGRTYCATSTPTGIGTPQTVTNVFNPIADTSAAATDRISATTDGKHILGATATPAALKDIAVTFPAVSPSQPNGPGTCTNITGGAAFSSSFTTVPLASIQPTAITGVQPASNSALAFVTYTGTSGLLPLYVPAPSGIGTVSYVTLSSGAASAPVAGVFSTDNLTFYAGTSGDNAVHVIAVTGTTAKDASTLTPNLPAATSGTAVPNLIAQRPKRSTS
jgi:trimeric autotransporter adhesin